MHMIQSVIHCFNVSGFFKDEEESVKGIPSVWGVDLGKNPWFVCCMDRHGLLAAVSPGVLAGVWCKAIVRFCPAQRLTNPEFL